MKILNFISQKHSAGVSFVFSRAVCGFPYEQVAKEMSDLGYYIPEDQYQALQVVLDIQIDLDIGSRQDELKNLGADIINIR